MNAKQEKYTPGPWEISTNSLGALDICKAEAGDMIADLNDCENAEANARLIAQAPQMANLLRTIDSGRSDWPTIEREAERILSAIDGEVRS